MTSPSPFGCFFLDTNIILSDILKENTPRIEKLKKDSSFHGISCYITDSIEKESYEKVQQTSDFLGSTVRETIRYYMLESRKKRGIPLADPITSDDVKTLEDLFAAYHDAIRTYRLGLSSPVSLIEEWAVSFLGNKIDQRVSITINQFLIELVKTLLKLISSLEDSYDDLVKYQRGFVKVRNITLDSRIVSSVKNLDIHKPDCDHIAGALIHQTSTGEKTVFVTLDFRSILTKRCVIVAQLGLECCGPLYAVHHLV